MSILSAAMVLFGAWLFYQFLQSEEIASNEATIWDFIRSPSFMIILLGLFMYMVSGKARKMIKKKRQEEMDKYASLN